MNFIHACHRPVSPRRVRCGAIALLVLSSTFCLHAQAVPAGTLFPVLLDQTLDSHKSKPGERISAKLMQDVPLPDVTIKRGAKLLGQVTAVSSGSGNVPWKLSVQFNRLESGKQSIPINVSLRALASLQAVGNARQPINNDDAAATAWDLNRFQVGGQVAFTGQRIVKGQNGEVVGHIPEPGAVLGVALANPDRGCPEAPSQAIQAFWLFSTDACGVYDQRNLSYDHGTGGPKAGVIVFQSTGKINIRAGSGWLLQQN